MPATCFMEYKEAIEYLYSRLPMFSRVGAAAYKPGLERAYALAEAFDNPQNRFKSIHIAGTNGKGSTSHLIAAVLQSQGYKTALYTSPHLTDFRERMRINGEMIPREKVVDFVERWKHSDYPGDAPSFFELTMMMAFEWFAAENVDYAVIETGMGGRLDSTNIIRPLLSVITNISNDHTQFLGDTPAKIAFEKAGIIKPDIPVVIGEASEEVENVFRQKARECNSRIREAYTEYDAESNRRLNCSLKGAYQKWNVNTARVAVDEMRNIGIEISGDAELCGFSNVTSLTGLRGRWMQLGDNPLRICDTGHNIAGISYNMQQLDTLISARQNAKLRMVIGFVADKDVPHILDIFPHNAEYYITNADIPRAMPMEKLLPMFIDAGYAARGYKHVGEAYIAALQDSAPDDIIFIGGSTFVVADLLNFLEGPE